MVENGVFLEPQRLLSLCRKLNSVRDFQKVAEIVVDEAMKMVNAEATTFWLLDGQKDVLLPLVVRGPRADDLKGLCLQRGEGIPGQVVETKEPVLVEDVTRESRWTQWFDSSNGFITRSMIVLPIVAGETAIGVLQLVNKRGNEVFNKEDLRTCQQLVELVATIIYNCQLCDYQERFLVSLLKTIAHLAETHSQADKGHGERVCSYSLLIADQLGLSEDDRRALAYASLLHDLGKLMEDDQQKHPTAGAQLVYQMEPKELVYKVWLGVLYHHERFDGNGYPAGLRGEDIPLIARIIAVADLFDHLYRDGNVQSLQEALEELKSYSGSHLDPVLVEKFLEAVERHPVFLLA
ncbi:MAG: Metal dependent phosphohydrolase [Thermoanaerobacterales bacterium 50_218]|nr:MAG: Metal dependent phosphohydrolase [Thermoanaerobacterales bacterium 50_218]